MDTLNDSNSLINAGVADDVRVTTIAAWLRQEQLAVGESITNRVVWQALAQRPEFADIVERGVAAKDIPAQPDDLFLDFSRTGNRDRWQDVAFTRRAMIETFTLAECLENKGRFIPPMEKLIAALCEEPTWVLPAHDGALKNFRGETVEIDLFSAILGWELATADRVLGDKLAAETRNLIRTNLEKRIFAPYRTTVCERKEFWWMRCRMNWNAVCHAGVVGAALAALESRQERAWFIAAAEHYTQYFLQGFTPDGYCGEGVGYWNFGFGHFVLMSEAIRYSTDGKLDLLTRPKAAQPALFGARTEIAAGIYPSISDCNPPVRPNEKLIALLSQRFGFNAPSPICPSAADPSAHPADNPHGIYETLIYAKTPEGLPRIPATSELAELAWRTWFPDGGVLICRTSSTNSGAFAACLKGGNNAEDHNHNDVGTFMVVSGRTMLICDPGGAVYTARTFGPHRYESEVLNSYGHAVPVIAGKLQYAGADARGNVLETRFTPEQDLLKLGISSAYDVPTLTRLDREFVFTRGALPSLTVTDELEFSAPETYEAALITWSEWKRVSDNELVIYDAQDAVRVQIDSGGVAFDVRSDTLKEAGRTPTKPVRIALQLKSPITHGQFKLTITPVG